MVVLGNPPYSGISANASTRKETVQAAQTIKNELVVDGNQFLLKGASLLWCQPL
jgi:hypothetical protein